MPIIPPKLVNLHNSVEYCMQQKLSKYRLAKTKCIFKWPVTIKKKTTALHICLYIFPTLSWLCRVCRKKFLYQLLIWRLNCNSDVIPKGYNTRQVFKKKNGGNNDFTRASIKRTTILIKKLHLLESNPNVNSYNFFSCFAITEWYLENRTAIIFMMQRQLKMKNYIPMV